MKREPISGSSNIAAVGYDAEEKLLEVEFTNGGVYRYADVEPAEHQSFVAAPSLGRYLAVMIKPKCECTKVDPDDDIEEEDEVSDE